MGRPKKYSDDEAINRRKYNTKKSVTFSFVKVASDEHLNYLKELIDKRLDETESVKND